MGGTRPSDFIPVSSQPVAVGSAGIPRPSHVIGSKVTRHGSICQSPAHGVSEGATLIWSMGVMVAVAFAGTEISTKVSLENCIIRSLES